jgi:hypothetical protein
MTAPVPARRQSPRERYEPLPDDKLALFEVVRVDLLLGVWQGPGTIAQLRREQTLLDLIAARRP